MHLEFGVMLNMTSMRQLTQTSFLLRHFIVADTAQTK